MNMRSEILKEHSKKQSLKIAGYIGNDAKRFAGLMQLFLNDEYRVTQRSAWVVSFCADKHPELITPWMKKLVNNLTSPTLPDAVKRNTLRVLQNRAIPKSLQGALADSCFNFLASNEEPVAVKVFAMTVLANISQSQPGLKNELRLYIEEQLPYASAGFKARAKRILMEQQRVK